MKAKKTTTRRSSVARKKTARKSNGVISTFLAGAAGAAGTHAVHKIKSWATKRKSSKAKAQRAAKKPVASASSPVIGEVASALRNLGYRATEASERAHAAYAKAGRSGDFETVFRAAMQRRNPGVVFTAEQVRIMRELDKLMNAPLTGYSRQRIASLKKKLVATAKNPKRKPAVASKRARKTFRMFTGAKSKRTIVRRTKAKLPGNDFAKIGDLVSLTIGNRKVSFENDATQPIVVTDAKAKKLFFLGGNQDLRMLKPVRRANPGGMHDMGEVDQIEYYSRKKFDDFRPTVYFHKLGEENGIKPRLLWDPKQKQMYLAGGDYKIKDVGIVN